LTPRFHEIFKQALQAAYHSEQVFILFNDGHSSPLKLRYNGKKFQAKLLRCRLHLEIVAESLAML